MKIKRITAALASLAIASTMALSAYADTTIEVENAKDDAWSNCFQGFEDEEGDGTDDYVDAKTFTKDQDLTITVEYEWTEAKKLDPNHFILIGPGRNFEQWAKFGEKDKNALITDYPQANNLDESKYKMDGESVVDAKTGETEPIFVKADGYIMVTDDTLTEMTFTIPKEEVNSMIEQATNAEDEDDQWDGIVFQVGGGVVVKKLTFNQDGIKLASQNQESEEGDSKADESKEESKADDSKEESKSDSSESKADSKAESKADDSSDSDSKDGLSTGAVVGIAIGALVVIGGAIVVVTKKK